MEDCIFCKIRRGEIPSEKVYEDEQMMIIKDIEPKAQRHYLCIPKNHFKLLVDMTEEDKAQLAHCLETIPALKEKLGLEGGYRLIINQGENAGQSVFHLHIHILSGQKMAWNPA